MDKRLFNYLILICLIVTGVVVYSGFYSNKQPTEIPVPAPVTTPKTANADGSKITTVGSPDGKASVTMTESGKSPVTYVFILKDEKTGLKQQIYKKSVNEGTRITIPLNTFSPDNKYLFLKEDSAMGTTYFVPMGDSELNINQLFASKYKDFVITDVTGWGGMNLIVVNTDKIGGGVGPSFWFEVPSKSFIRLTNRFN